MAGLRLASAAFADAQWGKLRPTGSDVVGSFGRSCSVSTAIRGVQRVRSFGRLLPPASGSARAVERIDGLECTRAALFRPAGQDARWSQRSRWCIRQMGASLRPSSTKCPKQKARGRSRVLLRDVAVGVIGHQQRRDDADDRTGGNVDGNRIA